MTLAEALFAWLDSFIVHVAAKRALALAGTESSDERRTELFARWHESMRSTAERLRGTDNFTEFLQRL